jgi:hypothetical protein
LVFAIKLLIYLVGSAFSLRAAIIGRSLFGLLRLAETAGPPAVFFFRRAQGRVSPRL